MANIILKGIKPAGHRVQSLGLEGREFLETWSEYLCTGARKIKVSEIVDPSVLAGYVDNETYEKRQLAIDATLAEIQGTIGGVFAGPRYQRGSMWKASGRKLIPPDFISVNIGGVSLAGYDFPEIDLGADESWDYGYNTSASQRAGKDFYIYACRVDGESAPRLILSSLSTRPSGAQFTDENTRRIGGFHCLCLSVGDIPGHPLYGRVTGDILPASLWDLRHRPLAEPEGMVYHEQTGAWYQIYLTNPDGGSAFRASPAGKDAGPEMNGYNVGSQLWFIEFLARQKMTLLSSTEFQIVARGSNIGTAILGAAFPKSTGGNLDTTGRRMISDIGLEDCCGAIMQYLNDFNLITHSAFHAPTVTGNNGGIQSTGLVGAAGGNATHAANCGPACRQVTIAAWLPTDGYGGRGRSPALVI